MAANNSKDRDFFSEGHAKSYDQKNEKLGPIRDSLLHIAKAAFSELPENARILCIGAGTGDEVISLAEHSPAWRFTLVEPSASMLDICKSKLQALGLEDRCTLHEGYMDTLEDDLHYDAATCLLVGHFIPDRKERINLYRDIASHLKQGGYLLNADLSVDKDSINYEHILSLWEKMWGEKNLDVEALTKMRENFKRHVSLLPPNEIEKMIMEAGYGRAIQVYQSLLIHGWLSPKI